MALLKKHHALVMFGLAAMDTACMAAAFLFAVYVTMPITTAAPLANRFPGALVAHLPYLLIFVVVWFVAAVDLRLWGTRRGEGMAPYMVAVVKAAGDAAIFCVFVMVVFARGGLERDFLMAFCIATLVVLLIFRFCARLIIWDLRRLGFNYRRMVVVGANERAAHLVDLIRTNDQHGYVIEGVIDDDASRLAVFGDSGLDYLGPFAVLEQVLRERSIDEVYIALPVRSHYETVQHVAHLCEGAGVRVRLVADLFPLRIATSRLVHIEDIPLLSLSTVPETRVRLAFKRAFDFAVASTLLATLSPIFLAIAIIIKLESRGTVFFHQERVGQNQRRFRMIKFRSMVTNAEALRASVDDLNEADGPVFKIRNDPRITRIGKFLRKYSIDEFPQLINVWRGEMSLVGPRPPIASEVAQYSWDQRRRLSVKPGMTGLWQVSGRSDVNFTEWVEMDLAYIDSWSLFKDFKILLKTFRAVIEGRGAA